MNKDEYRKEILNELKEIKLDTEVVGIFSVITNVLLLIMMFITIFK